MSAFTTRLSRRGRIVLAEVWYYDTFVDVASETWHREWSTRWKIEMKVDCIKRSVLG